MNDHSNIPTIGQDIDNVCSTIVEPKMRILFNNYLSHLASKRIKPPIIRGRLQWRRIANDIGVSYTEVTGSQQRRISPLLRRLVSAIDTCESNSVSALLFAAEIPPPQQGSIVFDNCAILSELERVGQKIVELTDEIKEISHLIESMDVSVFEKYYESEGSKFRSFSRAISQILLERRKDINTLFSSMSSQTVKFNRRLLRNWATGKTVPRSVRSLKFVQAIECGLELQQHELLSKLERISSKFTAPAISERAANLTPIPSNLYAMSSSECEANVRWIADEAGPRTTSYSKYLSRVVKISFGLQFTDERGVVRAGRNSDLIAGQPLSDEVAALTQQMTAIFPPPGVRRKRIWRASTANARRKQIGLFFGALHAQPDVLPGGRGVPLSDLTLALLLFPAVVDDHLQSSAKRRGQYSCSDEFFTHSDLHMIALARLLVAPQTGWLWQNPRVGENLRPIEGLVTQEAIDIVRSDWRQACLLANEHLADRAEGVAGIRVSHRATTNYILSILESEDPFNEYMKIPEEIIRTAPDSKRDPVGAAESARADMMTTLGIYVGARCKNMAELRHRGKGEKSSEIEELERLKVGELNWSNSDGGWRVIIPISAFKNQHSLIWKDGPFIMVIPDDNGLYKRIENYSSQHRRILIGIGNDPGTFFVKTCRRKDEVLSYTSESYSEAFRRVIGRFGVKNPINGQGAITGIRPFGPHCCRDIRATHVIKAGGTLEEAANSICDSVSTVKKHYARFAPKDRLKSVARFFVVKATPEMHRPLTSKPEKH